MTQSIDILPADGGSAISQHLEALTPKSLDDIFRKNRHLGAVAIADEDQLAPLWKSVPGRVPIRGNIEDWRFIAVTVNIPEESCWLEHIYLHGTLDGESWITSPVQAIDLKRKRVQTKNSRYGLQGTQGKGEPDAYGLIYICGAFNQWGWGPLFGVPDIFF